jgi:hypothetical protein
VGAVINFALPALLYKICIKQNYVCSFCNKPGGGYLNFMGKTCEFVEADVDLFGLSDNLRVELIYYCFERRMCANEGFGYG